MNQSIFYEKLRDRDLWVDGTQSFNIDALCDQILQGKNDFLESSHISEDSYKEVKKFIDLSGITVEKSPTIKTKSSLNALETTFTIPEEYHNINLEKVLVSCFKKRHDMKTMSEDEKDSRLYRLADELELYSSMGLFDVLKCAKYIVDRMKAEDVVWGPGRGSACCSYVLYLLEIHDIDSYEYDLSIDEFLR